MRCIAIRDGDRVRLLSRNDLSMNDRYPEVVEALEAQECRRFAIDGEVVAFDHGQTSFARLARRGRERVAVFLYAFDITWLDGRGRARPAADRAQAAAARRAGLRRPVAPERTPPGERRGVLRGGLPQGVGGADRQARRQPVHGGALEGLAQVQVRARPGAGGGRLHASEGLAAGPGGAADGVLLRRRAALRRQGGHRLRPGHPDGAGRAARAAAARALSVRRASDRRGRGHVGRARAGGRDRLHRVDPPRPASPPQVPGAALRQAGSAVVREG